MEGTDDRRQTVTDTASLRRTQCIAYLHLFIQRRDTVTFLTASVNVHPHSEPTASAVRVAIEHQTLHPLLLRVTTGRPMNQPIILESFRRDKHVRFQFTVVSDREEQDDENRRAEGTQLKNIRFVVRFSTSGTGFTQTGLDVVLELPEQFGPRRQSPVQLRRCSVLGQKHSCVAIDWKNTRF